MQLSDNAKGICISISASCLFGLMYYYATMLHPLDGIGIFGWRMLITLPFLTFFMRFAGYWHLVPDVAAKVRRKKSLLPLLVLSSFLVGVQLWLFLWAPVNGRALQVSLGYLLMPLVMVVCGRFIYKEHLQPYQKLAVGFAALGVANQIYQLGEISWEVVLVATGFPAYFVLRRKLGTDHLGGLWFDMLFMLPAAVIAINSTPTGFTIFSGHPEMLLKLPFLGVLSTVAIALYILACKLLPLSLFGLLSYVEPVLLVLVSLLLGERIPPQELPTYIGIFLAVATLAFGGIRKIQTGRHH